MRRILIAAIAACALAAPLALPDSILSDEEDSSGRDRTLNPRTVESIDRGLAYLTAAQSENGSWENQIGYKLNYDYRKTGYGSHVGVTALAGMALIANGHLPDRGKYNRNVAKALEFVMSCVSDRGYIQLGHTRMYSHAFAALFLSEIYGMSDRADLRDKIKSVVDLLVHSQNPEGGWRYQPFDTEADVSITVCQLQFLRSARNCGIAVPPSTIERAIRYVKNCRVDSGSRGWGAQVGAFKYQANRVDTRSTFALTAAGLTALNAAGVYDDPIIKQGIEFLMRERGRRAKEGLNDFHYFYGHYYAIQAFYQAGGKYWNTWWQMLQSELIEAQKNDGSWNDEVGPHYATAMATLILSVPMEYLPIFQK